MKQLPLILFLVSIVLLNGIASASPIHNRKTSLYISHFENVLGTSMEIKIAAKSPAAAAAAEQAAIHEIQRLSKILSAYDPGSEFSQWAVTINKPVQVSSELFEVLALFDAWRLKTNGALDAGAALFSRLWKDAATTQQLPSPSTLSLAVAEVQQSHWLLNTSNHTATHLNTTPLILNSFVKSYIIQHAVARALVPGQTNAVVMNVGGDIVVAGNHSEPVLLSDPKADAENDSPMDQLLINNKAVATSGNYRWGELINGHWYSHIIDPRTGLPADNILSATVVAANATDAGALATAFNVMRPAESMLLASTIKGAEYLIITKDGTQFESKGWKNLEMTVKNKVALKEQPVGTAPDFELLINLEINLQKEGFAKRPYVAVWLEDENHAAIRSISVWHGSDRYMPELKSWYLKYRGQYTSDPNFRSSVTSATRSAGKYTLKWDGKDDKGEMVKPGKYILKIEASREHGTYQLMRQEIEWNNAPKQIVIPGNVEIAGATLDYRLKSANN
jgi:thiamine biosynthesis lipoprotein ApbE